MARRSFSARSIWISEVRPRRLVCDVAAALQQGYRRRPGGGVETVPTKAINYALFQVIYRIIRSKKDTEMAARIVG